MKECRIPRRVMEGRLYGVRPIGRPRNRWTDAVTVDAKKLARWHGGEGLWIEKNGRGR